MNIVSTIAARVLTPTDRGGTRPSLIEIETVSSAGVESIVLTQSQARMLLSDLNGAFLDAIRIDNEGFKPVKPTPPPPGYVPGPTPPSPKPKPNTDTLG